MTKSNLIWVGTLGLLVGGLAIDRYSTGRQLKNLQHKYEVVTEAAAERGTSEGDAIHESPASRVEPSNATPRASRAVASALPEHQPSMLDPQPKLPGDEALGPSDQAAHIDTVFSAQSQDNGWSRDAESALTNALLPFAVGGARIQQVACRSTLCKVRVEHPTDTGIRDFVNHAFAERGYWKGPMVTMRDPTSPKGTFANVMYFSKEGHDIPFLEN